MAQVIGRHAFRALDSLHQFRFEPDALFHVGSRQAFAPTAILALRQIGEWAFFAVKFLELPKHTLSCRGNEAVTHTRSKDKLELTS
jgi:hypothetical protein